MNTWTSTDLRDIDAAEEVRIATRRADGSLRGPTVIWAVVDTDRVFIRSTNGRTAAWFRHAITGGGGGFTVGGRTHDVVLTEAADADLAAVDAAYRNKYRRYASIVDHLLGPDPRSATLQVSPA